MKFALRIFVYILGLLSIAFGVVLSVQSNLGVSPVNSFPYVVSLFTPIKFGTAVFLSFLLYIALQICILRREYRIIDLSQIVFSTVFGYMVDILKPLLSWLVPGSYISQITMIFISVFFVSLGVCLYMNARLVNMPKEGLCQAVADKILVKWKFHSVKVLLDVAGVALAVVLSLLFLGGIYGVREGTVISAIGVGALMPYIQKFIKEPLQNILF